MWETFLHYYVPNYIVDISYRLICSLQPRFSSTPSGPISSLPQHPVGQTRQALGSLASQENVRQQVLFRGPGSKTSGVPFPSPLSSHSLSAQSVKGQLTPPNNTGVLKARGIMNVIVGMHCLYSYIIVN